MQESPIAVTVQRLLQSNLPASVYPIRPPDDERGNCVAVNRLNEQAVEGNVHAVMAVTVYAGVVSELEQIGYAVISALRDEDDKEWSFGSAKDVRFCHQDEDYLGGDYTGWDPATKRFVRTIEFLVSW